MLPREDDLPEDRPNYTDPTAHEPPGRDEPEGYEDDGGRPDWAPRAAPPPALASGPTVGGILQGLKRRWWVALGIGVVLAAVAAVGAFVLLEPPFNAFAMIKIATVPPWLLHPKVDMAEHRNEFVTYQRMQASHIRGRRVLNAALVRPEVQSLNIIKEQPDPLLWLEEQVRTEFQDTNEVLTIAMTGMNPDACRTIVNGIREAYFEEVVKVERKAREDRKTELERLVGEEEAALRTKNDNYIAMAEKLGSTEQGLTMKQRNLIELQMERRRELTQVKAELKRAQANLKAVQDYLQAAAPVPMPMTQTPEPMAPPEPPTVSEALLKDALSRDPGFKELIARHKTAEKYREKCEKHLYEGNAELKKARNEHNEAKAEVEARKEEVRAALLEAIKAQSAQANAPPVPGGATNGPNVQTLPLEQAKADVASLTDQAKELQSDVDTLTKETENFNRRSTDLERLGADIKGDTERLEAYKNEMAALKIELRATVAPRVTPFQEAGVGKRDTKRQYLGAIVVPIVMLVAVCFLVGWWESRARRIHSADEVARGLGVRVVGAVPAFPRWGRKNEEAFEHILTESIDGIRTRLLREAGRRPLQVVMVTSAVSGEGKTTLASQLAGSLARAGRRTLLIDADLRRPTAHQLFELPLQPGLSEVLLDEVHVAEATLATEIDGLWMVPAGHWDREVVQALAKKDKLSKVFAKLRNAYDFVVIDSHPVLAATDSQLVGLHADTVILAVMREVSQTPKVYEAFERLGSLHIRVMGAVVNGLPEQEVFSGGCSTAVPAAR